MPTERMAIAIGGDAVVIDTPHFAEAEQTQSIVALAHPLRQRSHGHGQHRE